MGVNTHIVQYQSDLKTNKQTNDPPGQNKKQYCSTEAFIEEKCSEVAFEGKSSGRLHNALGDSVPDVRTEVEESAEATSF